MLRKVNLFRVPGNVLTPRFAATTGSTVANSGSGSGFPAATSGSGSSGDTVNRRLRRNPPKVLNEQQKEMRKKFLEKESEWEAMVDFSKLDEQEKLIHRLHKEAVENFHFTYIDPLSGNKASTRLKHFLRGKCCGSACRHCVYKHENVSNEKLGSKIYNSAFWVDNPDFEERDYFL